MSTPIFHWLTVEETIARQKVDRPLSGNRDHSDPTADEAIGKVYRQEKSKRKEAQTNGSKVRESGKTEKETEVRERYQRE